MPPRDPEQVFRARLRRAASVALDIEPDTIPLSYPPGPELGDLASPLCFELARTARRAPKLLAEAIVEAFEPGDGIARVEAAAGYINAFFDRPALLRDALAPAASPADDDGVPVAEKVIVEHTNINPNKAAHIGHLRNAVLGDTLVRCLRRLGRPVEVQNYIDDTGVQVADLVVGFLELRGEGLEEVRERYSAEALAQRGERFDYVAWDLYADVTRHYAEHPDALAKRAETLEAMEHGDNPTARLAAHVSRRMVQHHLTTMDRIDVRYDVLPRESDILALRFWDTAFERLRDSGAIVLVDEGKHAGCWVMRLDGAEPGSGEDEKVIVRSNGTVTYVGKDIAYQLWKFGLLGRDFHYEPFDWSPAETLYRVWSTCAGPARGDTPAFGRGGTVYNVIDVRQSYLQRVVSQGLRQLGHEDEAERSVHYSYEMVALSPAAVEALFPDLELSEEDRGRAYIEMSGRKGLGVRADDLLDELLRRAASEVRSRNPDMPEETLADTASAIAVGALRYYMLRFTRNRVVAFDLDAALAFQGETGPYLQYSVVRARNILAKLAAAHGEAEAAAPGLAASADFAALPDDVADEHWGLAQQVFRSGAAIEQAVETLELSTLAKHAYTLAQSFNSFYHQHSVVDEADPGIRRARAAIVRLYHDGMVDLLGLMGLRVPDRM